jgi:hypothetical protein
MRVSLATLTATGPLVAASAALLCVVLNHALRLDGLQNIEYMYISPVEAIVL